jgi:proton-dependent oligopeptide transporter, POT family
MSLPKTPDDVDLPSNVYTSDQLKLLPSDCLSTENPERPLRHVDDRGNEYFYALNPKPIILLILMVEMIERFSYYGVYYTQTLYLTGVYNSEWNAGFTSVEAASFVSLSTAVAYTTPFIGAFLSDTILGDYKSIVIGAIGLYLPGLLLVALTTVPYLLGDSFNQTALSVAVLGLWPLGTGIVKSVVNVFGARQYHPLLQSSFIESYYVNFYTSINIGALVGISFLPLLAQRHVTMAYILPVALLAVGLVAFLWGTPYYVTSPPRGDLCSLKCHTMRCHASNSSATIPLTTILRISLLIVPFCIAYSQMPTTFIIQGTVMDKAFYGFLDAASMNSLDAVSVLFFGNIMSTYVYPYLVRKNYKLATTYKFAIGSFFGALSLLWALLVEIMIRTTFENHGRQISVLWQTPSYILIGIGEIFAVSAAYEAAFVASSPSTKALASAINIFCVGGLPNLFCIGLYKICSGWFRNTRDGSTNLTHVSDYVTANIHHYFTVLVLILFAGIVLNVLPSVCEFVDSVEQRATDLVKTPLLTPRRSGDVESTPLLRRKFERPLVKMGSMRAGPSLRHIGAAAAINNSRSRSDTDATNPIDAIGTVGLTKSIIHRLYHGHHSYYQGISRNDSVDQKESSTQNRTLDHQETL